MPSDPCRHYFRPETSLTRLPPVSCPQINSYVGEWLSYQKLWDLNSDLIFGRLGDDIGAWMACAEEMK